MRKTRNSGSALATGERGGRLLLHLGPGLRRAIDPDDIYFVEATGDDTEVRTRAARALRDVRPIGVLEAPFLRQGFLRTHRNYLVNPRHVREVRRRSGGEDWELMLDSPVNLVLPVSRSARRAPWARTSGRDGRRAESRSLESSTGDSRDSPGRARTRVSAAGEIEMFYGTRSTVTSASTTSPVCGSTADAAVSVSPSWTNSCDSLWNARTIGEPFPAASTPSLKLTSSR